MTIGITGTIGSGKSTVGQILKDMDIPVIDTDEIVHSLLASDEETRALVVSRFGEGILDKTSPSGGINRKALGEIVFRDDQSKKALENILHPRVRQTCRRKIDEWSKNPSTKVIATLVPLLFEANLGSEYDQNWAVITSEETLKER